MYGTQGKLCYLYTLCNNPTTACSKNFQLTSLGFMMFCIFKVRFDNRTNFNTKKKKELANACEKYLMIVTSKIHFKRLGNEEYFHSNFSNK